MPFIPAEDTAQVELVYSYQNEVCENVFHVKQDGGWTVDDLIEVAENFRDWWINHLRPLVPTSLALTTVKAKDVSVANGPGIEVTNSLPSAGLNASGSLPNNVTLAIKWLTGLTGRSYRGRSYHVGLSEDQVIGNIISPTPYANIAAAYDDLLLEINTVGRALVVCSKYSGGAPRAACVLTEILNAQPDNIVDSQRRRLPGRGT